MAEIIIRKQKFNISEADNTSVMFKLLWYRLKNKKYIHAYIKKRGQNNKTVFTDITPVFDTYRHITSLTAK